MMKYFVSIFICISFAYSLFGLGHFLSQKYNKTSCISLSIGLGLGIYLFIGGIFNLAQIAFGWTAVIILLGGALNTTRLMTHAVRNNLFLFNRSSKIILIGVFAVFTYSLYLYAFPVAFNYHDDLHKYFNYPAKMLATGSAFGSSLSAIGSQVLGAQSFGQLIFVYVIGEEAMNIFDAVFCFTLLAALILETATRSGQLSAGFLGLALLLVINPIYVNTSSIYSSALFVAISLILIYQIFKRESKDTMSDYRTSVALGLSYASTISLKTSMAIFPPIFFGLFGILALWSNQNKRTVILFSVSTIFVSVIFLSAWGIYPISQLLTWQSDPINLPPNGYPLAIEWRLNKLFDLGYQVYSTPLWHFWALTIGALIISLSRMYQTKDLPILSIGVAVASIFLLTFLGISNVMTDIGSASRYAAPIFIGTVPILIAMAIPVSKNTEWPGRISFITSILLIALLLPNAAQRIQKDSDCQSALSFRLLSCRDTYINYNAAVLSPEYKSEVRRIQNMLPAETPFVAYIDTPYLLDFSRNTIFEADVGGLNAPWSRIPEADYFLIQANGYATRSISSLVKKIRSAPPYDRAWSKRAVDFSSRLISQINSGSASIIGKTENILLIHAPNLKKSDLYTKKAPSF